jgi:hypothetical protein
VAAVVWYIGGLSVILAVLLVAASWRARRSVTVAAFSLCILAPAILALGYRVRMTNYPVASARREGAPVTPRDGYTEGYAWAVDNGIETDSACHQGNAAFVDGCRKAVHRGGR